MADGLVFEMPVFCVCCVGPAKRTLDLVATKREVNWVNVALTTVGTTLAATTGIGFRMGSHSDAYEAKFRVPCCERCLSHITATQIGWAGGIVAGVIAAIAIAVKLGSAGGAMTFVAAAVAVIGLAALGGLVIGPQVLGRVDGRCAAQNPIQVKWKNEKFELTFMSKSWGDRVVEMNSKPPAS
jgi:hypothetical protein